MAKHISVAIDLGASSGRHVGGLFDGQKLELSEIHRFENLPVEAAGTKYWNLPDLWSQIQLGLKSASAKLNGKIDSIGVDTCGSRLSTPRPERRVAFAAGSLSRRSHRRNARCGAQDCFAQKFLRSPAYSSCRSTRSINLWQCSVPDHP